MRRAQAGVRAVGRGVTSVPQEYPGAPGASRPPAGHRVPRRPGWPHRVPPPLLGSTLSRL